MRPYYSAGGITIYHGDNAEVLPALAEESIDLVLTSPPYNLGTSSGEGLPEQLGHYPKNATLRERGGLGWGTGRWKAGGRPGALGDGYGAHDDAMPFLDYVEWQKSTLLACWRLLSGRGAIYYNHKPRLIGGEAILPLVYNPGLPLRQIVMWDRGGGINCAPTHYRPSHEWLCIFAQPAFRLRDKGASSVGDVWRITPEINTPHPAPFPFALALRVLKTTPAGRVLDPFAGWGTTLLAAKMLGRPAVGVELEERFCEMAAKRLSQEVLPFGADVEPEARELFDELYGTNLVEQLASERAE